MSARALTRPRFFPPAETADRYGLVGVGGELSTPWLLDAYRHGIFPWPVYDDPEMLAWWSPDPRAVLEFDAFHVPRRLQRTLRSGKFTVTCDQDFVGVIDGCATAQDRLPDTWITPPMRSAYIELHEQGVAHSVEAWHEGQLVGGVYGVAIGGMFAAESMFYRESDASKVALVSLVTHLQSRGYRLLDVQQYTPNSARFGAIKIPRPQFLKRLAAAIARPATFGDVLETGESKP